MAYHEALEAAGATVHAFESFGSYQGEWWAKVTTAGRTGWVGGSYGSCSGCDAFEGEFGWGGDEFCDQHRYNSTPTCEDCSVAKAAHDEKLARFGQDYLDGVITQDEAEAQANRNLSWDLDAQEMLDFIRKHKDTE